MPDNGAARKGQRVVIACRVMKPELSRVLAEGEDDVQVLYLDQSLHRTPNRLQGLLQEGIDRVAQTASRIVLGYGLCSNGVVGVAARQQGLIIPRCHDCIAFFLGSPDRYQELFTENPGTYYLTPGWITEKQDPLGIMEEYIPRFGQKTAKWVVEEELKHYTRIAMIATGVAAIAPLRARAKKNATFFKKLYEEIPGSLDYFREFVCGPYPDKKFFHLRLGEKVAQEMFL